MTDCYTVALVDGRKIRWQSKPYTSLLHAKRKLRTERKENPEQANNYKILKAHWYVMKEEY